MRCLTSLKLRPIIDIVSIINISVILCVRVCFNLLSHDVMPS